MLLKTNEKLNRDSDQLGYVDINVDYIAKSTKFGQQDKNHHQSAATLFVDNLAPLYVGRSTGLGRNGFTHKSSKNDNRQYVGESLHELHRNDK